MPFESISPLGGFTGLPETPEPPDLPDPTLGETFSSAFRIDNIIGSSLASEEVGYANRTQGVFGGPVPIDPDFDPWAEIAGTPYEAYGEQFGKAGNKDHFEAIKADIDRENRDRDIIHRSGLTGFGASMAAGVLDLPILLPGGAIMRSAKGGVSLLKTAGTTAAAGTLAATGAEAALHSSQQLRTLEESGYVIGGSTILSGVLGLGFGKLFSRAEQRALAARIEQDFRVPGHGEADPFTPGSMKVEPAPGASERARMIADTLRQTVEELQLPPNVRVQVADRLDLAGGDQGSKFAIGRGGGDEGGDVVPFRRDIDPDASIVTDRPAHARAYAGERLEQIETGATSIDAIYADYQQWARQVKAVPIARAEFVSLLREAGLDPVLVAGKERYFARLRPDDTMYSLRAFHASPHEFTRFDTSKIGTGEGAQAFGHGLYFAENELTAQAYQRQLAGPERHQLNGKDLPDTANSFAVREYAQMKMDGNKAGLEAEKERLTVSIQTLQKQLGANDYGNAVLREVDELDLRTAQDQLAALNEIRQGDVTRALPGNTYEVEIDVEPEQLLDWDLPLAEQGEAVRNALATYNLPDDALGNEIYNALLNRTATDPLDMDPFGRARGASKDAASNALREAGIPGIRYLDQGSRGLADVNDIRGSLSMWEKALSKSPNDEYARQQVAGLRNKLGEAEKALTRNIVIFDDSLVKITAKNGKPVTGAERQKIVDEMFGIRLDAAGERIAEGRFDPENLLITISADALDPIKTLKHESVHALRSMGLLDAAEWGTLERAAGKQGWIESNNVRELYEELYRAGRTGDDLNRILTEEAIAEQFSLWRQGAKQVDGPIAKLFERIRDFLDRFGNALRGQGFRTADDVFAAISEGRTAGRGFDALAAPRTAAGAPGLARGASIGASAVDRAEDVLKSAFGMEKAFAFQDPGLRTLTSRSAVTRRYSQELHETPLAFTKNVAGNETAPLGSELGAPGSVEARIRFWQAPLADTIRAVDDAFLKYRKGRQGRMIGELSATTLKDTIFGTRALTYRDFKAEISTALRNGDQHQLPEVAEAAKTIRTKVLDPLKDEAIAADLLPEGVGVETAPSYLNRLYNREKIIAERDQFKAVIRDWLTETEANNTAVRDRLRPLVDEKRDLQASIAKTEKQINRRTATADKIEAAQAEAARLNFFAYQRAVKLSEPIDEIRTDLDVFGQRIQSGLDNVMTEAGRIRGRARDAIDLANLDADAKAVSGALADIHHQAELADAVEAAEVIEKRIASLAKDFRTVLNRQHLTAPAARQSPAGKALKALEDSRAALGRRIRPYRQELARLRKEQAALEKAAEKSGKRRYSGPPLMAEEIDTIAGFWRYIREVDAKPTPERLSSFIVRMGGVEDPGGDVLSMIGRYRDRPGLIRKGPEDLGPGLGFQTDNIGRANALDAMALRAWEEGFFPELTERPAITDFLDKLAEDLQTGTVVRGEDAGYFEDFATARQMEEDLVGYGISPRQFRKEARLRAFFGQKAAGDLGEDAGLARSPGQDAADAAIIANLTAELKQGQPRLDAIRDEIAGLLDRDHAAGTRTEFADLIAKLKRGQAADKPAIIAEINAALERNQARLAAVGNISAELDRGRARFAAIRDEIGGLANRLARAREGAVFETRIRERSNTLADQASGKRAAIADLADDLARRQARLAAVDDAIETEVGAWQGKSASRAQSAIRRRDAADAARTPEQRAKQPRLKQADRETLRAARRMVSQLGKEPAELDDLADQIIDRILGTPDGRLPYDAHMDSTVAHGAPMQARGPLAPRVFMIPDRLIEPWLENDIEELLRSYVRTMGPDIELKKRFGSVDMVLQIKEIAEDYARKAAAAKTPDERRGLQKKRDADIGDLAAIRDRLRGTYNIPKNPDGMLVRAGRVAGSWNYMRMLGGMTVSAIPDLARPIMVHGVLRTVGDGIVPLFRNWSGAKLAAREVKLAGTALDMVLDSRAMRIADVKDDFGRHTKFERALFSGARNFGIVSLMAPWNAAIKQLTGLITMTRMLQATEALAAGKIKPRELEALAAGGISRSNALAIAEQFKKHGRREGGVWFANTASWDQGTRPAIEAFRAALARDVDRIIVTPSAGDRPLWMSTEWGRLLGQFKSFAMSSMQRTTIAGLQQSDAAVFNGAVMMIALGGLVHVLKARGGGHDPNVPQSGEWGVNQKTAQFMVNAVDRSGLTGWLMDANAMSERFTRGAVGLAAVTGKPISRYASRNFVSSLLGPTAGTAQDAARVAGSLASGEWNQTDTKVMKRLLPYNNVFYLRNIFDNAEQGINDYFGVPEK